MLRLAVDENFNQDIIRGVLRRLPRADVRRVQDVGLIGADDPIVLAWAADEGRVLLTNDVRTMTKYAYARIEGGQPMPGLFELPRTVPVAVAIEELLLLIECSQEGEWSGQVRYLPFLTDRDG